MASVSIRPPVGERRLWLVLLGGPAQGDIGGGRMIDTLPLHAGVDEVPDVIVWRDWVPGHGTVEYAYARDQSSRPGGLEDVLPYRYRCELGDAGYDPRIALED